MGTVFHKETDNFSTFCLDCGSTFHIAFFGDSDNPKYSIEEPCLCSDGPSAKSVKQAKEIMVYQIEQDPEGRNQCLKERGIK